MAIVQRNPEPGLIVHSDQGMQYAAYLSPIAFNHQSAATKPGELSEMTEPDTLLPAGTTGRLTAGFKISGWICL